MMRCWSLGHLGRAASLAAFAAIAGSASGCVERTEYPRPPSFQLTLDRPAFVVRQDEWLELSVEVQREEGLAEPIELELHSLPGGFTSVPATIGLGERAATLRLRPEEAPVGAELAIFVRGRSSGAVASASAKLLVVGRVGEYRRGAPIVLPAGAVAVSAPHGLPGGGLLFVSPSTMELVRRGPDGLPLAAFAAGRDRASYAAALGGLAPVAGVAPRLEALPDGRMILAISYDDPSTSASSDGILVTRLHSDGRLDDSFGAPGARRALVPLPGGELGGLGAGVDGSVALWARTTTAAGAQTTLARLSAGGALEASQPVAAEIAPARRELLVQPDRKVVAATSAGLVRFHADLSRDLGFGVDGLLPTGLRPAQLVATADGYLAVGEMLHADPDFGTAPRAALWRFDAQWRLLPGFAPPGTLCGRADLAESPAVAAFDDGGETLAILGEGAAPLDFAGNQREGARRTDLGARWSTPGTVTLWRPRAGESFAALVWQPPRRALLVIGEPLQGITTFQTIGVWY